MLGNFSVRMQKYFHKKKKNCPQKVEKNIKKSCILMAVGSFFFSATQKQKQNQNFISVICIIFFYTTISARISAFSIVLYFW